MQTIKKYWIYILFGLSVCFFVATKWYYTSPFKLKTFKADIGWGYEIYKGDDVIIQQRFIPGIEGRKGFINEREAETIGNLVIHKIEKGNGYPSVTIEELDSCKISTK